MPQVIVNVFFLAYALRAFILEFYDHLVWELDTDGDGDISRQEIVDYFREKLGFMGPPVASIISAIVHSKVVSAASGAISRSSTVARWVTGSCY